MARGRDRPDNTRRPTSFETFPFPWPLDTPDEALTAQQRGQRDAIGEAARALDEARRRWLNPPELVREEPDVLPSLPPRLLPANEDAERELRRRTLTNLYNARPAWLSHLHTALDTAVFAAYGWPESVCALGAGGGGAAGAAAGGSIWSGVGVRLRHMANDAPAELSDGWPDAFDDEARDYLYEESRQRLVESIEFEEPAGDERR